MKDFREQNYYELLDAKPHYSTQELEQCYQRVKRFLSPDSVATYALFQPEELNLLRRRIEEAFRVLSSPERRQHYDQEMGHLSAVGWPDPVGPIWGSAPQDSILEHQAAPVESKPPGSDQSQQPTEPPHTVSGDVQVSEQATSDTTTNPLVAPPDPQLNTSSSLILSDTSNDIETPNANLDSTTPPGPLQTNLIPDTKEASDTAMADPEASHAPSKAVAAVDAPVVDRDDRQDSSSASILAAPPSPAPAQPKPTDAQLPKKSEPPAAARPCAPAITPETKFTGELLKQLREAKGLSLERVAEITKINIFYLRTIEEEHYSNLPAEVYIRGYLRMVSQLYGLDARQVINTYLLLLPKTKS